jgi:4-amino-4-deoxychorismate lyase
MTGRSRRRAASAAFSVGFSSVTLGTNPLLAGLKHLNRLEQVLAQMARDEAGLDEVLMLSSAGQVIGGSMSNVFLADDSGLFTPELGACGVAGVMRRLVLEAAARWAAGERAGGGGGASWPRVREVFVTNVRWGVQSVRLLDGRALPSDAHAQQLRTA